MDYAQVRTCLVLLLLVSMVFFPSAQQAFAISSTISDGVTEHVDADSNASDVTVEDGGTLIIDSGFTLSLTGLLTINEGGTLIIEDGGKINFVGTNPLSGIANAEVSGDGGTVNQFGAIVFVNTIALIYVNSGVWTIDCNGTTTGGPIFQGTPIIDVCVVANIPPTLDPIGNPAAILEDAGAQVVGLTGIGGDDGTQTLTVTATSANTALILDPTVTYTSPDATGSLSYTPVADANGEAIITVTVSDGIESTEQTFTVTVTAVNDEPEIDKPLDEMILEDAGQQTVDLTGIGPGGGSDESSQKLTIDAFSDDANVVVNSVKINGKKELEYTAAADYNNAGSPTITITLTLTDDNGTPSDDTDDENTEVEFTVTVTAVNDEPTFDTLAADPTIPEDDGAQAVAGFATGMSAGPANELGQTLSFIVTANTNLGLFSAGPTIDATTGELTYTAADDANGSADITIELMDDGGTANGGDDTSVPQTFTITVTAVNDPPVAGDDEATVPEGGVTTTNLVLNDVDVDDGLDLTSIVITSGPTNGILVDNGDGTVQYTHDGSETLSDSYTYTIDDVSGQTSNTATVDITVISGNDSPIVSITSPSDNDTFLIGEPVDFVGTATDPEDGDISASIEWFATLASQIGTGASFSLSTLSEGVHVITAQIVDSLGFVDTTSITITIQIDLENELFCDDKTIAELEKKAMKGKYNLIDNRLSPIPVDTMGTDKRDLILASNFGDTIRAMGGNDCVIGGTGNDNIEGGDGDDQIFGLGGDDTIRGNDGNDRLEGGNGGDRISGDAGNDKIDGGNGGDDLVGGDGNDHIKGGDGDDEIAGDLSEDAKDELGCFDNPNAEGCDARGNDTIEGGPGSDFITGGPGNDKIKGGDGGDEIFGDEGDDKIEGGAEDDIIHGGPGNDKIKGGDGEDEIFGGKGNDKIEGGNDDDILHGNAGNDHIKGGDGDDIIKGHEGNDKLEGGNGNDDITGGTGNDKIKGGDGDDTISGGAGRDKINGGNGNDDINGGLGNDHIKGGDGDDTISGGAGDDKIDGDKGNDIIRGGDGDDDLKGSGGKDVIDGDKGNDKLAGGSGDDILRGGDGNDYLKGGSGDDDLQGQAGDDKLKGGRGNDVIAGGDGDDKLDGNKGNDLLLGGDGNDYLKGGSGDDDLQGQAGDDTLKGQKGIDLLDGGDDFDTCKKDKVDTLLNCEIEK